MLLNTLRYKELNFWKPLKNLLNEITGIAVISK